MAIWDRAQDREKVIPPPVQTIRPTLPIDELEPIEPLEEKQPEDVEQRLKDLARKIKNSRKKELVQYLELGAMLTEAQSILATAGRDGEFSKWFKSVGLSKSNVYRAMEAHKHFGDCANMGRFNKSSITLLAKHPKAKDQALKEAAEGQTITVGRARALVRELEPEPVNKKNDRPAPIILKTSEGFVTIRLTRTGISPATVLSQAMALLARQAA